MAVFTWIVRAVILLLLIWLAIQNTELATFSLTSDIRFPLPLIVLLFGFFALGLLMGVAILLPKNWVLRWEARKLRKEIEQQKAQLDKAGVTSDAPTVDVPPITM
jgi:uncharacterized integral membrane protein